MVVTTKGMIQGFSLTKSLKQYDLSVDAESKETSEKQLELSRKKVELTNKISQLQKKKEDLQNPGKS